MKDNQIIELYWQRDERAIIETISKYEVFCRFIAGNILRDERDIEECVNDTWLQAWNSIPPQRPENLKAWLGRVVRNLAINCFRKEHRMKRHFGEETSGGIEKMLAELLECVPAPETVEHTMDAQEMSAFIDAWLKTLPEEDHVLFVRRYWNGESVKDLAERRGEKPAYVARRLQLLRERLKKSLEKEGYVI